jgi:hypothetical protein
MGTSKKGFTPLIYRPSQYIKNAIETKTIDSTTIKENIPDTGYPPNPAPPTTILPSQKIILPPENISIGVQEIFTVSVNGSGSTATYTSNDYHGMVTGDNVVITGFNSIGFNGTYTIQSYTLKTFTVNNLNVGTDTNGSARNYNNNCGTIVIGEDGSTTIDVYLTFDEVLNASDYKVEVIKID